MTYVGKGANVLAKVPLSALKPPPPPKKKETAADLAVQYARLEQIVLSQNEEIAQLQKELLEEKEKNAELEEKLQEINDFLEDYGMHWVGGPGPKDLTYEHGPDDMNRFMVRITELNDHCLKKRPVLKQEKNIAKLHFEKPVLLSLYNDYFTVNNGERRDYSLPVSAQFFRDIMDGYYPSEFKEEYPDGVQFKVEDNRGDDMFKGKAHFISDTQEDRAKLASRDKRVRSSDQDTFGEGDGNLQLRVPPIGTKTLKSNPDMKMREIRRFIINTFGVEEFEICDPITGKQFDDDATLQQLNLYPRGIVSVMTQRK